MANDDEIVHWFLANRISAEQRASYLSVQGSDVDVPEIDTCEIGDPKDIDVGTTRQRAPANSRRSHFHSDDGEMGDDPDYSDGDATWVPAPAMAFDSHVELKLFLETYARKLPVMSVTLPFRCSASNEICSSSQNNVQFKAFATKERSVKLFGHDGAWARGRSLVVVDNRIDNPNYNPQATHTAILRSQARKKIEPFEQLARSEFLSRTT